MRMTAALLVALGAAGCGRLGYGVHAQGTDGTPDGTAEGGAPDGQAAPGPDGSSSDVLAADARGDADAGGVEGPFVGPPELLFQPPEGHDGMDDPTLTGDMLEMYCEISFSGAADIYVTTRLDTNSPWDEPTVVAELSSPDADETNPEVSADGLTMYLNRGGPLLVSTRLERADPWSDPVPAGFGGVGMTIDQTGTIGVVHRTGTGLRDLYEGRRASPADAWDGGTSITSVNTAESESNAMLSWSGLAVYWSYGTSVGDSDIYFATRSTVDEPFGDPQPTVAASTAEWEADPWISPDGRSLVFTTSRDGIWGAYIVRR